MINNIKAARERSGKTQKECADCLSITLRAWQGYEQGIREPKYEILCSIADLFHVTTDYLLGRETREPNAVDDLAAEFNMSALEKKIVDNYLSLPKSMRGNLMEFLQKTVKEVLKENGD